jgi:predicted SprT family Zn-dependent metalloprotease
MKFLLRKKRTKRIILRPFGQVYNLQEIYEQVNEEYFGAKLNLKITWFGRGETVPKTRITFGSYTPQLKLIKVNRLLDREYIPEFFVRYIVYHEMLHEAFPPKKRKRGTHHIHHSEFKEKEKAFPHYGEVKAFIQRWKDEHFSLSK